MLADAFPERAAAPPQPTWRRAAVSGAVLVLHFLILYTLLHALVATERPRLVARKEITIYFPPKPKAEPDRKKVQQQLSPENPVAPTITTSPITIPPLPPHPPSSDQDGIGRLGRYLNNCSAGNYRALSPQEWAYCLGGMATQDHSGTVTLGDIRTLWEKQHPKSLPNPKEADGFVACPHDDPRRRMGLPCFQHNGERPSVSNGQQ